jgi:hypothetical protein
LQPALQKEQMKPLRTILQKQGGLVKRFLTASKASVGKNCALENRDANKKVAIPRENGADWESERICNKKGCRSTPALFAYIMFIVLFFFLSVQQVFLLNFQNP